MKFVYFTHSLVSDWNHGNAHFLRGIASELQRLGHQIEIYEPADGWSLKNLRHDAGDQPLKDFSLAYPKLRSTTYDVQQIRLDAVLGGADVVIVHEGNDPRLVAAIGRHHHRHSDYHLLFHDTHHRAATAPDTMRQYELDFYDGVLAFGERIRQIYLDRGWADHAWTRHEAADARRFAPPTASASQTTSQDLDQRQGDLVWVGNWGDGKQSVLGGMIPVDPEWLKLLDSYGALDGVEVVAIHGFSEMWWPHHPNWDWARDWQGWQQKIDSIARHAGGREIWITETGLATWDLDREIEDRFELQQAMLRRAAKAAVERVYWYTLIDLDPQCEAIEGFHVDENEYHLGLVTWEGQKKPAFKTFQHLLTTTNAVDLVKDPPHLR